MLRLAFNQRLDFNSLECRNYLNKFEKVNQINATGPTTLAYKGEATFIQNTSDLVVSLTYFDSLYNDPIYYGLSTEDGKPENTTCLDLKLFQFQHSNYSYSKQVDLPFTKSSNFLKSTRSLSFTIKQEEFYKRLVFSSNSNSFLYVGYYAIAYYATKTNEAVFTFYFQFEFRIGDYVKTLSSSFISWNQYETQDCSPEKSCIIKPSSTLKFCTDSSCSVNTVPNLSFKDQFYIQQVVNIDGLRNFSLINTKVYYIGDGLIYQTIPLAIDDSQLGQVTILLSADIVWSDINIQVISILATNTEKLMMAPLNEILQTYDPVNGEIKINPCISYSQDNMTCPGCYEECSINGFSRNECFFCYADEEQRKAAAAAVAAAAATLTCCCCCCCCIVR